jgi:ribosomal 50S subunit-associated protein YjgA (DUF615 family)
MINLNYGGEMPSIPQKDEELWDSSKEEEELEQEALLLLKESQIALGKLEIQKLELESSGLDDLETKLELKRIETEIARCKKLVTSLGGEVESK